MFDNYIIEVRSGAAGIVVRDGNGFRFFAARPAFNSLEGRYFASAREAERAARHHVERRRLANRVGTQHPITARP